MVNNFFQKKPRLNQDFPNKKPNENTFTTFFGGKLFSDLQQVERETTHSLQTKYPYLRCADRNLETPNRSLLWEGILDTPFARCNLRVGTMEGRHHFFAMKPIGSACCSYFIFCTQRCCGFCFFTTQVCRWWVSAWQQKNNYSWTDQIPIALPWWPAFLFASLRSFLP